MNAAEPLRQSLAELRGGSLRLDGSQVERLGGLCLQVLVSARKTWIEDGHDMGVANASGPLLEQLRLFGADDLTIDPSDDSAFGVRA